jgi:hypothetical protein
METTAYNLGIWGRIHYRRSMVLLQKQADLVLFRFYEEGDAASIVIPRHSQFRKNIDWLDDNFPR